MKQDGHITKNMQQSEGHKNTPLQLAEHHSFVAPPVRGQHRRIHHSPEQSVSPSVSHSNVVVVAREAPERGSGIAGET